MEDIAWRIITVEDKVRFPSIFNGDDEYYLLNKNNSTLVNK